MEQKLEGIYMGAAAVLFAVAMLGCISMEKKLNQSLQLLQQQMEEDRVVISFGGSGDGTGI